MSATFRKAFWIAALALAACTVEYRTNESERGHERAEPVSGTRVRVALFRPAVTARLSKTIDKERLHEMWRAQFEGDPLVSLVSQSKVDKAQRKEAEGNYNFFRLGDAVRVYCVASHRMATGFDKRTRKIVKIPVLVLTATIERKVAKTETKVSVEGSFFKNAELIEQLARKVKAELR